MLKSLAFTGHRNPGDSAYVRDALAAAIERAARKGYIRFYAGGAIGSDWIATEEVIKAKERFIGLELVLALPCQDYNAKWGEASKAAWALIVEQADEVHYLNKPPLEDWMYHHRNHWMIARADVVVAVYDGREGGGTAATVGYAKMAGKAVYVINPKAKREGWER